MMYLKWRFMYYLGFSTDTGAIWTRHCKFAALLEPGDEVEYHTRILTQIEEIPLKEIEVECLD